MRKICQLNYTKMVDPRLRILRRTKAYRQFQVAFMYQFDTTDVKLLRQATIVMLNLMLLDKPEVKYREIMRTLKSKLALIQEKIEEESDFKAFIHEETKRYQILKTNAKYRKEAIILSTTLSSAISRISSERNGDQYNVTLRSDEIRTIQTLQRTFGFAEFPSDWCPTDEALKERDWFTVSLKLSDLRALFDYISSRNYTVIDGLVKDEEETAEEFEALAKLSIDQIKDHLKNFQAMKAQVRSEKNVITGLLNRTESTINGLRASKPWIRLRLLRIAPIVGIDEAHADDSSHWSIVVKALQFCIDVFHSIVKRCIESESFHYDRYCFEDIRMCLNMCIVAQMTIQDRLQELAVKHENRAFTDVHGNQIEHRLMLTDVIDIFKELWSYKSVWMYPDARYDCLFTISRYRTMIFRLEGSYTSSKKVPAADVLLWVIDSFNPKKHQPQKARRKFKDKICEDTTNRIIIPLLSTINAFFRFGVYMFSRPTLVATDADKACLWNYAHRYKKGGPVDVDFFCNPLQYRVSMIAAKEYRLQIMMHVWNELERAFEWQKLYRVIITALADTYRHFNCLIPNHQSVDQSELKLNDGALQEFALLEKYSDFIMSKMATIRSMLRPGTLPLATIANRNSHQNLNAKAGIKGQLSDSGSDSDDSDEEVPEYDKEILDVVKVMFVRPKRGTVQSKRNPKIKLSMTDKHALSNRKRAKKSSVSGLLIGDTAEYAAQIAVLQQPMKYGPLRSGAYQILAQNLEETNPQVHAVYIPGKYDSLTHYLFISDAIYQAIAMIGAMMVNPKVLPHEQAVLNLLRIRPIHILNFLSVWRFSALVGYWLGMTREDEYLLLIFLADFYTDRLGPSTIANAAVLICNKSNVIHSIAYVWTRVTSFLWYPLSKDCCDAQMTAVAERVRSFNYTRDRPVFERLSTCTVCRAVLTVSNIGLSIGRADSLKMCDAKKVIGFAGTSIDLTSDGKTTCSRQGLNVSQRCNLSPVVYVPLRCRRILRTELDEIWQLCGECGIPMQITRDEIYTVTHPQKGAMCCNCSTSTYSVLKITREDSSSDLLL